MRLLRAGHLALFACVLAACGEDATSPPVVIPDAGAPPSPPVLSVVALASQTTLMNRSPSRDLFMLVEVRVQVSPDAANPVPVASVQFSLALGDGTILLPTPLPVTDGCPTDRLLGPGGNLTCVVAFDVEASASLSELRFRDPTINEVVSATLPSSMVPPPFISGQRAIGMLQQQELDAVCGEGGGPMVGESKDCPFQMGMSTVRSAGAETCGQRQFPAVIDQTQVCFRFESGQCTVSQFRACRTELATDLCALTDPNSPCACALPIVETEPTRCP